MEEVKVGGIKISKGSVELDRVYESLFWVNVLWNGNIESRWNYLSVIVRRLDIGHAVCFPSHEPEPHLISVYSLRLFSYFGANIYIKKGLNVKRCNHNNHF